MPSNQTLILFMGIVGAIFAIIIVAYFMLKKQLNKGDIKRIKQLREGTKEKRNSSEVIYQKLYVFYKKIPVLNRYVNKLRRKLEIIHIEDEYLTRKQTAKIITRALIIIIPTIFVTVMVTKEDALLLSILMLFEVFLVETIMSGMVDKQDTKLLKQQIDFFAEIRHNYHEYNMVEEAIYETSQNDELEVSRQGEKIYEILISDDPEIELEKYYDVAPNSYLKEFAGVSYLTREFGDRTINGASLYLKNLNNITEEMQLEILKREKLDYVFQSLSFIAIAPVLILRPLRTWAVSNFAFTAQFYDGKLGLIAQIILVLLTFICYILTRKLKDNGSIKDEYRDPNNTWQMKLYKNPIAKKFIDLFIPKDKTKEYRMTVKLMKEAATKQKMETLYINKITIAIISFIVSLLFFVMLHAVARDYVYTEPTSNYDVLGQMSGSDLQDAMELTKQDNIYLERHKGNMKITREQILVEVTYDPFYADSKDAELEQAADRIIDKLKTINSEYMKWFELLLAFLFGLVRI